MLVARYCACEVALWYLVQMGLSSVAVCGVVPAAAVYSAGVVACRMPYRHYSRGTTICGGARAPSVGESTIRRESTREERAEIFLR